MSLVTTPKTQDDLLVITSVVSLLFVLESHVILDPVLCILLLFRLQHQSPNSLGRVLTTSQNNGICLHPLTCVCIFFQQNVSPCLQTYPLWSLQIHRAWKTIWFAVAKHTTANSTTGPPFLKSLCLKSRSQKSINNVIILLAKLFIFNFTFCGNIEHRKVQNICESQHSRKI
jgi:hypothetical protein